MRASYTGWSPWEGIARGAVEAVVVPATLLGVYQEFLFAAAVPLRLDDHVHDPYEAPPRGQAQSRLPRLQRQHE